MKQNIFFVAALFIVTIVRSQENTIAPKYSNEFLAIGVGADALAEASEFICIGCVPHGLVCRMVVQLAMFEHFTSSGN